MKHIKGKGAELVFLISTLTSILAVAMIYVFLFANDVPAIGKIGIFKFLVGEMWKLGNNIYGIFPMILGSIHVAAGVTLVDIPIEMLTTVFMVRFYPKRLYKVMKPAIDLPADIPSVICGSFRLVVTVPAMSDLFGGSGRSIAMASVLLGIMTLLTIIGVSESATNAVPDSYYEGALALGAGHKRSVFFATLPAARSETLAGVILGAGRAIGETMAVIMATGNQPGMPKEISQGMRTLTANIIMEVGYVTDLHREALIVTAVVPSVFVLLINSSFFVLSRRAEQRMR